MNVQVLIDKLSTLDPNLDILCSLELTEETSLSIGINALEIDDVESTHLQCKRSETGVKLLFGKSETSELLAVLTITNDI